MKSPSGYFFRTGIFIFRSWVLAISLSPMTVESSPRRSGVTIIAAMDGRGLIGRADGSLPWKLPMEMKLFKEHTINKPVLMGRKTFDSLPGGPLKDRHNLVLSNRYKGRRQVHRIGEFPSVVWIDRLSDAWFHVEHGEELMVIGGAEIYKLAMPFADRFLLTLVKGEFEQLPGDVFFPKHDLPPHALQQGKILVDNDDFTQVEYLRKEKTPLWVLNPRNAPPLNADRKAFIWQELQRGRDFAHEIEELKWIIRNHGIRHEKVQPIGTTDKPHRFEPGHHGFTAGDTLDW